MTDLYEVVDPRPIAAEAKYTFFLPFDVQLNAIEAGDLVKVMLRAIPPSKEWDAERVWLRVIEVGGGWLQGTLESDPYDMPLVRRGAVVRAPKTHVIDVLFETSGKAESLLLPPRREYWERCLVDQAVIDGDLPVHYLYREEAELAQEGDENPDSGWRIRGDMRETSDEELQERESAYVAIGVVLNQDDSWLNLIDEPAGSMFERDFERGVYVRLE